MITSKRKQVQEGQSKKSLQNLVKSLKNECLKLRKYNSIIKAALNYQKQKCKKILFKKKGFKVGSFFYDFQQVFLNIFFIDRYKKRNFVIYLFFKTYLFQNKTKILLKLKLKSKDF